MQKALRHNLLHLRVRQEAPVTLNCADMVENNTPEILEQIKDRSHFCFVSVECWRLQEAGSNEEGRQRKGELGGDLAHT